MWVNGARLRWNRLWSLPTSRSYTGRDIAKHSPNERYTCTVYIDKLFVYIYILYELLWLVYIIMSVNIYYIHAVYVYIRLYAHCMNMRRDVAIYKTHACDMPINYMWNEWLLYKSNVYNEEHDAPLTCIHTYRFKSLFL